MKLIVFSFLCLLSTQIMGGALQQSNSKEKETILWVKWKLLPEYIERGEFKNEGYLDKFLNYVNSKIPEYNHKYEYFPLSRVSKIWKEGNVCTIHLWLGFWSDKIIYSSSYGFTPKFGIIVKKDSKLDKELRGKKSVSLKNLLAKTKYRLGILPLFPAGETSSRYPHLKDYISPYLNTNKVHEFRNSRNELSVDYLDSDRVDYILRQRITHFSEMKINHINKDIYTYYSIDEETKYKLVAAACSKGKLGKKIIGRVNEMIHQDQSMFNNYLKFRQIWDMGNVQFEDVYNQYFIKKVENPNITK
ncbi:hypothetical protein A9Q84_00390 [Halobacteriovorax marinus]|uniref:Solute-binding protein family 3/N-terminal domain-containing protein n=1 Tax=Halobacteriovorax marinus TaxID=97084 RepID=A0A1Y5FBD3_9BACT|nr:hypothetical protein A9Q84_00390 [Halobacteriovorax marinus]